MTKTVLRNKLKKAISEVEDKQVLQALYSVLYSHLHAEDILLTGEDKKELDRRLARHKAGLDKNFSWEETKARVRKMRKAS